VQVIAKLKQGYHFFWTTLYIRSGQTAAHGPHAACWLNFWGPSVLLHSD